MFWFDRGSISPGNFGFAIIVCRLRERGHMSKGVYVRVFNDLDYFVCVRKTVYHFITRK